MFISPVLSYITRKFAKHFHAVQLSVLSCELKANRESSTMRCFVTVLFEICLIVKYVQHHSTQLDIRISFDGLVVDEILVYIHKAYLLLVVPHNLWDEIWQVY